MRFLKLILATALLCTSIAHARLEPGKDYLPVAQPQSVDNPAMVEVIEFFWYGCAHCHHLEGKLNAWRSKMPKNVNFKRVPVMWGAGHEKHAQVFYTLEALGQLDRLHSRIFDIVAGTGTGPRVELRDENAFADWAAKQGLNRAQVLATYRSFGVMSQLRRAKQMGQSYGVEGVPVFYIQGKYTTSPSLVKDEDRVFQVINELIAQEQAKLPQPAAVKAAVKPAVKPVVKAVAKPVVTASGAVK